VGAPRNSGGVLKASITLAVGRRTYEKVVEIMKKADVPSWRYVVGAAIVWYINKLGLAPKDEEIPL